MEDKTSAAPNGGWGWFVVASAHLSMIMWDGDTKALAVLLPTLKEQFMAETWVIGWLIAGLSAVLELTGPIVGAINENTNIDPRFVAIVGGVLTSVGFIGASYATNILELTICISVCGGMGLGLSFVQSSSLVPHYFDTLYPRASSIVTCGTCVAMVVFAPLTQIFLDSYGWRGTLLLIGAINTHLIFSGTLLRPIKLSKASYSAVAVNDNPANETTSTISANVHSALMNTLKRVFPTEIFGNPIYILHMLIFCCSAFVLSGWYIYLVPHAIDKGLTAYEASAISSVAAIVSFIGRIAYLPLIEREILQIRTTMYAAITLSAVSLIIDPWMKSFWLLTLSSSMYFLGRGIYKSLFFVILNANIGAEHLASGLGWCLAIGGIFRALAGAIIGIAQAYHTGMMVEPNSFNPMLCRNLRHPVLVYSISILLAAYYASSYLQRTRAARHLYGWIYDHTGSYDYGFLLLGGVEIFSAVLLFIEDMFKRNRLQEMQSEPQG